MHAGVVELDALANTVGTRSQDDDGLALAGRDLCLQVVAGVEVGGARGELGGAGVHGLVDGAQAEGVTDLAHRVLTDVSQGGDLDIGESVALGQGQDLGGEGLGVLDLLGDLLQEQHLVQEPGVDAGGLVELSDRGASADGLLKVDQPVLAGGGNRLQQLGGLLRGGNRAVPVEDGALLVQ